MFFGKIKTLAETAINEIQGLSAGSHATSATFDAMKDRHDAAKKELNKIYDRTESKRNRAWLVWVGLAIPNMFISLPLISVPLGLISMAAAVVTGCQYLKMRAVRSSLEKLEDETDPVFDDARRQRMAHQAKQRQLEIDARRASMKPAVAPAAPAADGFNVAASDVDLDKDVTVRPIRLKPKEAGLQG